MHITSAYKTHTGLHRKHNEDFIWVDEEKGIYIVADGLGGHEAGDVASNIAATTIGDIIAEGLQTNSPSAEVLKALVTDAIEIANRTVSAASVKAGQKRPMGATIVLAVILPPIAYIAHAGDARAYLVHNKCNVPPYRR